MYSSDVYDALSRRQKKLAVVGMGYVGLPLAAAFSKVFSVIGFDINEEKIKGYQAGIDATEELGNEALSRCTVEFTTQEEVLRQAAFVVVAVPTPINGDKMPDLSPVIGASRTVGRNLQKGSIRGLRKHRVSRRYGRGLRAHSGTGKRPGLRPGF